MFKVIDNFLDKKVLKEIQKNILENTYFPWYFSNYTDYFGEQGLDKSKYIHVFYDNHNSNSKFYDLLLPNIKKLKCISLIKAKINSTSYFEKILEGQYHVDNLHKGTKTAIYYLNGYNDWFLPNIDSHVYWCNQKENAGCGLCKYIKNDI